MAEVRHASATWTGDLQTGSGVITYVTSGVFTRLPITWGSRTSAHQGRTSPEELLAAAHAACFSMALSSRCAKNGTPAESLDVRAEVTFEQVDGGWKITRSRITVQGRVPGMDVERFGALAEDAKDNCPISQALKGNVELVVEASLAD